MRSRGEDLDHKRWVNWIEGPNSEASRRESVERLHPKERTPSDLSASDKLEHRLRLNARPANVILGLANSCSGASRRCASLVVQNGGSGAFIHFASPTVRIVGDNDSQPASPKGREG